MESLLSAMTRKPKGDIRTLAIRHSEIIDHDKVRYRVYRSANEYIAVIAENALMAMKLSGVSEPYKVVRDLFHDGVAIEATKLRSSEETPEITMSLSAKTGDEKKEKIAGFKKLELAEPFQPLSLGQLKQPRISDDHIVNAPEMMKHIQIDPLAYAMATRSDAAVQMAAQHAPVMPPPPEPVIEPQQTAISEPIMEEAVVPVEATPTAPEPPPAPVTYGEEVLPTDEIARLLAEPRS